MEKGTDGKRKTDKIDSLDSMKMGSVTSVQVHMEVKNKKKLPPI